MAAPVLHIRVDATQVLGNGSLLRMLTLAEKFHQEGFLVDFWVKTDNLKMLEPLKSSKFEYTELPNSLNTLESEYRWLYKRWQETPRAIVLLDGYHFANPYILKSLRDDGFFVVLIDDLAESSEYTADVVINSCPGFTFVDYPGSVTQRLLGPEFTIVPDPLLVDPPNNPVISKVRRLLIYMGATDSEHVTLKLLRSLKQARAETMTYIILLSNAYPNWDILSSYIRKENIKTECHMNVLPPEQLAKVCFSADMAVSIVGQSCYELAAMGIPTMVIPNNPIQNKIEPYMLKTQVFETLGSPVQWEPDKLLAKLQTWFNSAEERKSRSALGRSIFHQRGADLLKQNIVQSYAQWLAKRSGKAAPQADVV